MAAFKNAMEIFILLKKNNCRKCNETTCLAFAGAVLQGRKSLDLCPYVEKEVLDRYCTDAPESPNAPTEAELQMEEIKKAVRKTDLASRAKTCGGKFANGRLTLKVCGKDVSVDSSGRISTDIHTNPWIMGPLFDYILNSAGAPVSGHWAPLRELKGGQEFQPLFGKRCEEAIHHIADIYTDLFEDLIILFNGKKGENHYESDISLVIHPFPKVPVLFCYWKPDEGLGSDFKLFFDQSAPENLSIRSLYTLGAGLANMFEKLAARHGFS